MTLTVSDAATYVQKPVNVIYTQTLLRNARPLCPYMLGTTAGQIARNGGTATIKWRRLDTSLDNSTSGIAPLTSTASALSEVSTASYMQGRTPATAHFSDYTATVLKYGQFFIINEEVDVFSPNGTMMGITNTLAITAGRTLNILQRNVLDDNATVVYVGGVASDGVVASKITAGSIDSVIATLSTNVAMPFSPQSQGSSNVGTNPMLPGFWGFTHPHVAYDIAKLPGFKSVETYAGQVDTVPGEFGAYGGAGYTVRFVQSTDATKDLDSGIAVGSTGLRATTTNIDLYTTSIVGMDAVGSVGLGKSFTDGIYRGGDNLPGIEMIAKGVGTGQPSGTDDPFDEITTLAYKFWHTGKILNANWCRAIRSGATNIVE